MVEKKTIFEIFKAKKNDFDRAPSRQAWKKLEHKLDHHAGKRKIVFFRRLAIAASFVLLAGVVFAATYYLSVQQNTPYYAEAVAHDLEELVYVDSYGNFESELQTMKDYRARFASYYDMPGQDSDLAMISTTEKTSTAETEREISTLRRRESAKIGRDTIPEAVRQEINSDSAPAGNATNDRYEFAIPEEGTSPEEPLRLESAQPSRSLSYDDAKKEGKSREKQALSTVEEEKMRELSAFRWLLGTWEEKWPGGRSVEKWQLADSNTIKGVAWFIQGDDTVFTENIMLKEVDDDLVWYQNAGPNEKPVPFFLRETPRKKQWIFENRQYVYPKALVVTVINRGRYVSELRADYNGQNPEITPAQREYLKNRNLFAQDRAIRKMQRTDI